MMDKASKFLILWLN